MKGLRNKKIAMKVDNGKIVLSLEDDRSFVMLIVHLLKIDYGDVRIEMRNNKPFRVVKTDDGFLLGANDEEDLTKFLSLLK